MDFLKKGQDVLNKNSGSGSTQQQGANTTQQPAAGQQQAGGEDYGDKGMSSYFPFLRSVLGLLHALDAGMDESVKREREIADEHELIRN